MRREGLRYGQEACLAAGKGGEGRNRVENGRGVCRSSWVRCGLRGRTVGLWVGRKIILVDIYNVHAGLSIWIIEGLMSCHSFKCRPSFCFVRFLHARNTNMLTTEKNFAFSGAGQKYLKIGPTLALLGDTFLCSGEYPICSSPGIKRLQLLPTSSFY